MAQSTWTSRIDRARHLRQHFPESAQVLNFYAEALVLQEVVYRQLENACDVRSSGWLSADPSRQKNTLEDFRKFLTRIGKAGPKPVSECASRMVSGALEELRAALKNSWCSDPPASLEGPETFLVRAFLQPYASWTSHTLRPTPPTTISFRCPVCQHRPGLAALRPMGEGGKRFLICSFCLSEWEFRRILCAGCGEENEKRLPVYNAESRFEYIRLECCDSCNQYLKAVDLTKNGLAEPIVDEVASISLDLWAREHGYSKIAPNLMGF